MCIRFDLDLFSFEQFWIAYTRVIVRILYFFFLYCSPTLKFSVNVLFQYLDFDNLPDTNFSCDGKVIGGYYADVETGCQMFHVCTIGQKGKVIGNSGRETNNVDK